jgi:SAM-dependent methyltransferase
VKRRFPKLYKDVLTHTFDARSTALQAERVRKLLRLRKGERVLDMPCGQGRISLPLARRGLSVVGLDLEPGNIRLARRAANAGRWNALYAVGDMRRLRFHEEFDAAFNWFGSFGYFSDRENLSIAHSYFRALKPGGRLLIEGLDRRWVRRHFQAEGRFQAGGVRVTERRRWAEDGRRVLSRWTFEKGRKKERFLLKMRLYTPAEIRALLKWAGFAKVVIHWGSLIQHRGPGPRRWMAVAVKGR